MFKLGDRVWGIMEGWGTVAEVYDSNGGEMIVEFDDIYSYGVRWYKLDGRLRSHDKHPVLFYKEIDANVIDEASRRYIWRAKYGDKYYCINSYGDLINREDIRSLHDDKMNMVGNYFKTEKEARESNFYKAFYKEE